jgi:hypothetical protein
MNPGVGKKSPTFFVSKVVLPNNEVVTIALQAFGFTTTIGVVLLALQFGLTPPYSPLHVQFHGPVPATAVGVPELQRLVVGTVATVVPLALPQDPFTLL